MTSICYITKKKTISGNNRSNSMKATLRKFKVNIHKKKIWLKNKNKYIKINISAKGLKIIRKKGIEKFLF